MFYRKTNDQLIRESERKVQRACRDWQKKLIGVQNDIRALTKAAEAAGKKGDRQSVVRYCNQIRQLRNKEQEIQNHIETLKTSSLGVDDMKMTQERATLVGQKHTIQTRMISEVRPEMLRQQYMEIERNATRHELVNDVLDDIKDSEQDALGGKESDSVPDVDDMVSMFMQTGIQESLPSIPMGSLSPSSPLPHHVPPSPYPAPSLPLSLPLVPQVPILTPPMPISTPTHVQSSSSSSSSGFLSDDKQLQDMERRLKELSMFP